MPFIMRESFDIPVTHKGENVLLKASVKAFGYTPRIEVDITGRLIYLNRMKKINIELWYLQKICLIRKILM